MTRSNYSSSTACDYDDYSNKYATLRDRFEVNIDGYNITYCGDCSFCSNDVDIELMWQTKGTLTKYAQQCAVHGLVLVDKRVDGCLQNIGFTPDCLVSSRKQQSYSILNIITVKSQI